MAVVVGYLAGKCGRAPLTLAVELAHALNTSITVVSVVPKPWPIPSPARVDAEFASYAARLGSDSEREARKYLDLVTPTVDVSFATVFSRTAGDGLLEAVEGVDTDILVVGSSASGALGQVVLGSTTDWLLHTSPVPVALSPRGYRGSRTAALQRVTCAYSGTRESIRAVERVSELTDGLGVPLRVVSYAIRGRTMFPPMVGLDAEDSLLETWAAQLREITTQLKSDGIIAEDVDIQVVTGNDWDQVLDATEWQDGDLLALGTTSRRSVTGVFLGAHGAKIIRHSPVPVLVVPA